MSSLHSSRTGRTGSALLLTILTVSILLVIVLALVVMVRLELRAVGNQQDLLQARANARLGLDMAMGRLQDLAGPDQRVTAKADLFAAGGGNIYSNNLQRLDAKQHWAGVWDSTSFQEKNANQRRFLGWLVSGPAAGQASLGDIRTGLPADAVTLVGDRSVTKATDRVAVPKVTQVDASGTRNAHAYWVADEGLKARFNLQDPYRGSSDFGDRQNSLKAAQRLGAEMMTPADGAKLADAGLYPPSDKGFGAKLDRLLVPDQVTLFGTKGSTAEAAYLAFRRNRFHDMTLVSKAVLSDTRKGGLKKDLTLAFEMPLADFNASTFGGGAPNAEVPVYRPGGYPTGEMIAPIFSISDFTPFGFTPENSPDGSAKNPALTIPPVLRAAPWHMVRNYYRQYKETDADRAAYGLDSRYFKQAGGERVYQSVAFYPRLNALSPIRRYGQEPAVWTYAENYGPPGTSVDWTVSEPIGRPIFPSISPVITRMQTAFSARSRAVGTNFVIDLYIDPIVSLWNPYNVAISTGHRNGQPLQISVKFLDFNTEFAARKAGTALFPNAKKNLETIFNEAAGGDDNYVRHDDETYELTLDLPSGYQMEPGEVILFSGKDLIPYQRGSGSLSDVSGVRMTLEQGISYLPDGTGFLLSDPYKKLLPPGSEFRLQMTRRDSGTKFKLEGVDRIEGKEPFFVSLQAGVILISNATPEWVPADSPAVTNEKRPLLNYDTYLKPEDSPSPVNMMSQFNPRSNGMEQGTTFQIASSAYQPTNAKNEDLEEDLWYGVGVTASSWSGTWLATHNGGKGTYWGGSNKASGGNTHVSLFDIPSTPLLSLGSLQHAPLTYLADEPSFTVGNSFAPIFVRPGEKLSSQQLNTDNYFATNTKDKRAPRGRKQWTMTRPDWSYLLNETLWDAFFFSSIAPEEAGDTGLGSFMDFIAGKPLPNSTFSLYLGAGENATTVSAKFFAGGGKVKGDAYRHVGENLLSEGAFNINSTSVEAWRALLASTRQLAFDVRGSSAPITPAGTVLTRMSVPHGGANDKWNGYRDLSDAQIDTLAKEIVKQVRIRGPFLNLADFVNRRLHPGTGAGANPRTQWAGALQLAIEAAGLNQSGYTTTLQDKGLNKANLNQHVRSWFDSTSGYPADLSKTPVAMGNTGYLTQADLLTVIGPLLTPRSDTFTIRAYGERADPQGQTTAKAWCEAVVQRVPDYVDSARVPGQQARWRPSEIPASTGSYDSATPRRRFVITSFRWLSDEDV